MRGVTGMHFRVLAVIKPIIDSAPTLPLPTVVATAVVQARGVEIAMNVTMVTADATISV